MKLQLSNLNKPSEPRWKLVGDIALYAIPIYLPIILSLPISDSAKAWISPLFTAVLATIKILSKFTLDLNYVEDITESDK
jgi:hypothetical protein